MKISNNQNNIKYVGFYDVSSNKIESRKSYLPATNKMDYIIRSLNKIGYNVEIVSPSWTIKNKFYKGKTVRINSCTCLRLFPTLPWVGRVFKLVSVVFSFSFILLYLFFKTEKFEQIIVYHSRWLSLPMILLKKTKKSLNIILEVEEIYDDVRHSSFWRLIEYKLFMIADKYIFPTGLLDKKLNMMNKPSLIIYGTYQVEEDRGVKFDDGKIHVVYAGTFDPRKGGAMAAAAAEYLPKNYHVHIIGFGSNDDKSMLLKKIDEISKITKATVTYDGLLWGEEYIQFLQKCHIGLSTQNPNADFNETSFPSKILSYMANGLRVVTIRIKAIEMSPIGDKVFYYDKQTPKDIAEAIMSIDLNEPYDSRKIIKELDKQFVKEIEALLKV
jgi:glycosyltransferase involved in cell wall biosynthesis